MVQIKTSDTNPSIDIAVESIGVATNPASPDRTYMLHCTHCGKEQMRLVGKLSRIIAWVEPNLNPQTIHRCTRCGNLITITPANVTKTVLVRISARDRAGFFCPICSRQIYTDESDCPRCRTEFDFRIIEES